MTYEQAKDQIAKKYNHKSFDDYLSKIGRSKYSLKYLDSLMCEAVELYADSVARDAWDRAIKRLMDSNNLNYEEMYIIPEYQPK